MTPERLKLVVLRLQPLSQWPVRPRPTCPRPGRAQVPEGPAGSPEGSCAAAPGTLAQNLCSPQTVSTLSSAVVPLRATAGGSALEWHHRPLLYGQKREVPGLRSGCMECCSASMWCGLQLKPQTMCLSVWHSVTSDSVTTWTVARQGSSVHGGSPRQEYWNGLPFPSPGDLPDPGIEPRSPALQLGFLPSESPGKPPI